MTWENTLLGTESFGSVPRGEYTTTEVFGVYFSKESAMRMKKELDKGAWITTKVREFELEE